MMEYKIGDRFEDARENWGDVWEVIDTYKCKCIDIGNSRRYKLGEICDVYYKGQRSGMALENITYLGNFNKSANYNNLYNILNEA